MKKHGYQKKYHTWPSDSLSESLIQRLLETNSDCLIFKPPANRNIYHPIMYFEKSFGLGQKLIFTI